MRFIVTNKKVSVGIVLSLLVISTAGCLFADESSADDVTITSYYFKEFPSPSFFSGGNIGDNVKSREVSVIPETVAFSNTKLQYSQFEDGTKTYTVEKDGVSKEFSISSIPDGFEAKNTNGVLYIYMNLPSIAGTYVYKITGNYAGTDDTVLTYTFHVMAEGSYYVSTSNVLIGLPDGWAEDGKVLSVWHNLSTRSPKTYEVGSSASVNASHTYYPVYADAGIDGTLTSVGSTAKVSVTATVGSSLQSGSMIGLIAQYDDGKFINTFVDATYSASSVATANFQLSSVGLKSVLIEVIDGSTLDGETKTIGEAFEKVLTPSS